MGNIKVTNKGSQEVKALNAQTAPKMGTVKTGGDLRMGTVKKSGKKGG